MTYEEQINQWASEMKTNTIKILGDATKKDFLGLLIKNEVNVITKTRGVATIVTPIYNTENNTLIINIASAEQPGLENGFNIPIELGDKLIDETLVNLSNGRGNIDVYWASNDLKIVWATQILREEMGRFTLKRELKNAGLINEI